ncbi:MAG: hypothetical protein H8E16_01805 [Flavobacteriales bacterium]|nr:hypothetical protein [Flavobacteriales bacterium]
MFHNRITTNKKLNDKIIFMTPYDDYFHPIYNIIISKIESSHQYKNYYIVNTDMIFWKAYETEVNIFDSLTVLVNDIITSEILSEIRDGTSLLIFDFGSEILEISTDDTTLYGRINKFFYDNNCLQGVQYWTMYSDPYSIVDKEECNVDILSISPSTLRYTDFTYDNYKNMLTDTSVESKSMMYLNRRAREHRIKLLGECLHFNIDLDDAYFSFLCDSLNKDGGEDGKTFWDDHDINLIKHVISEEMNHDYKIIDKMLNEYYGRSVFLTDKNKDHWLGASDIGRVIELFNHRAKTKFEVITEFSCTNKGVMISEKLSLSMLSKIPFVVLGDKGYMNRLKELGFKTFDKFWDETYDTKNMLETKSGTTDDEIDVRYKGSDRIVELAKTISDIQQNFKCDIDEYGNYVYSDEMNEILEHNYNHYKDVYTPELQDKILKAVSRSEKLHFRTEVSDKIWYNDTTQTVVVPIPGNGMEYFNDQIADKLGYKLVNRSDVSNLSTLPAIAIIRNPIKRIADAICESGMTFSGFMKKYRHTDYLKSQVSFIEGLSLWGVIDLDNITDTNIYDSGIINIIKKEFVHEKFYNKTDIIDIASEQEKEIVNNLFEADLQFYNDDKLRKKNSRHNWISDELVNHFDTLRETLPDIENCGNQMIEHGEYFKKSLNPEAWSDQMHILKSIEIQNKPKDISILDMGTQYGIIPHFLSSIGFTDVSCSNSTPEASLGIQDLRVAWNTFNLSVIDLHIKSKVEFTLPKKYDIIISTRTNILFKTDEIFAFSQQRNLNKNNRTDNSMFFTPYNKDELKFFISNIKKFLNPDGIAVFQPYPFVYHTQLAGGVSPYPYPTPEEELLYEEELKLLSRYQTKYHAPISEYSTDNKHQLHDYFVITKENQ